MGVKIGIQVSKRELYTHTHIYIYTLDYNRVEILSFIKKNKNKKVNVAFIILDTPSLCLLSTLFICCIIVKKISFQSV